MKPGRNGAVARDGAGHVLDDRQAGQDVAGVVFANGDEPGVRLRKEKP